MSARITFGYAALITVLGVSVFAVPGWNPVVWAAIGLVSAGAIVAGGRLHRPARRTPWWWMSAALLTMAAGDSIYSTDAGGDDGPLSIVAEILYLALFPVVAIAVAQLSRTSAVLRDRSRLIDLLAFTCAASAAMWVLVLSPMVDSTGLDRAEKSVLAAYALGDLLIVVATARLAFAARRSRAVLLLAAGALGLLASNVTYAVMEISGTGWRDGGPGELGYLLFYACWGAAALHPSMAELTAPVDPATPRLWGRWIMLLGLSLLVPPGLLLAQSATGTFHDGPVIAIASMLMVTLALLRLADAIGHQHRAAARERELREAIGALVAAAGPTEIGAAVRTAVRRLLPPGVQHALVLTADGSPSCGAGRRTELLPTGLLDPAVRESLDSFPIALACPLVLPDRSGTAPSRGALFVAAARPVLESVRDAVEIIATQAALALERISLTDAAKRHDSDRHLSNVVRSTSDVVLIVDDGGRVRYASPALATILGTGLPTFATLREIAVLGDDRLHDGLRDQWWLRRCDGGRALVEVVCRDLRPDPLVRGFVITMRDVTDRYRREQERIRRMLEGTPAGQNRKSSQHRFR